MILQLKGDGPVLKEIENLTRYSVNSLGSLESWQQTVKSHPHLHFLDDAHIAVSQEFLCTAAGDLAKDPQWQKEFKKMVEYAASKGWTTEAGEIIGHIEHL